jgi:hypothetical protein
MSRKLLITSLLLILASTASAGPIFPTRGFLLHPKWYARTDTTSVFDHAGYFAEVQRGFGSDSDRWGWSVTMGAAFEFARWGGDKSLFGFAGSELIANTHNDIFFKPKAVMWEEGVVYAVHESETFDWQLGTIYRCRHDLDNIDPRGYSGIGEQRTLIYCSLSGKAIWTSEKLLGLHIPTQAWLHGDAYLIREDYRLPESDNGVGTSYDHLAWSIGESFTTKFAEWDRSAVYLMFNLDLSAFSPNTGFLNRFGAVSHLTDDDHTEIGYAFTGRMGRIQFYAGFEHWQDDGQTPIPRDASYAMLGVRVTGADMVTF